MIATYLAITKQGKEMKAILRLKLKLGFRDWLLRICCGLLVFVGGTYLLKISFAWISWACQQWKNVIVSGYGVCRSGVALSWGVVKSISSHFVGSPFKVGFLVLCLCSAITIWFFNTKKKRPHSLNKEKSMFSISDVPIKKASEDEFGREAYVRMLCTLIMSSSNIEDARYVGIFGQWGEGKTSVRFLLEERIRSEYGVESAIFVEFHPWEYSESVDIRMLFFEQLAIAVSKSGHKELSKVSSLLARHFALSRYNQDIGPVNELIDWFRQLFFKFSLSSEFLSHSIRVLLQEMQEKVIVVVDDLDRLSKEEVCRVIRFLKANGDLPNITYLILADENYLANAVASLVSRSDKTDMDCGREYLKKIIPLRCPLPAIIGSHLLNSFKRHLSALLTEYELDKENPKDTCDWLLKKYMHNARIGKEVLNSFSIKLATYKRKFAGQKYFGVHIGDLLALTIIEIYEPDIYNELWGMYMKFLQDPWQGHECDQGISGQWMEEHIFKHACGSREVIAHFLSERLGVSKSGGETPNAKPVVYKLDNPKSSELVLHYRLASQYCFRHYFILEEEPGQLSQDELERFLQEIREAKIPKEQILKLDESGLLPQLLYALESQKMLDTKAMSDCYITTLIYMANSSLKNLSFNSGNAYDIPQSIYVGIYRCLYFYCQEIKAHWMNGEKVYGLMMQRIGDMLMPIFSSEYDVILTAHLIAGDFKYHRGNNPGLSYDAIFSQEDYDKLCKMYLGRIEHFQREGHLVGHVEFFELFRCWRILLRECRDPSLDAKFREACLPMTKDLLSINSMIIFFCSDNRKAVNPPCLIVTIQLDDLTNAFGAEGVKSIKATLDAADTLPEYTCKAWVSLRWALENKEEYEASSEDEKMNCVKDLYEKEPYKSEMAAKAVEREPV